MTTLEHAIENTLTLMRNDGCYEDIMNDKLINQQAEASNIDMEQLYEIAQYVLCVWCANCDMKG